MFICDKKGTSIWPANCPLRGKVKERMLLRHFKDIISTYIPDPLCRLNLSGSGFKVV